MSAGTVLAFRVPSRTNASYPNPMNIDEIMLADPAKIPADRSAIPDDQLINMAVWAALQGVKKESVFSNRTRSERRRAAGNPKPGDMPAEDTKIGTAPMWKMSTFRAWQAARPGKGAGAGRPVGSKSKTPRTMKLPAPCPHCHREIRGEDLAIEELAAS